MAHAIAILAKQLPDRELLMLRAIAGKMEPMVEGIKEANQKTK